jgi:acetyl-CoA C-acetyltransferase
MSESEIVILSAARTPQGRIKGQLASLSAVELGAIAVRAALERSGLDASAVDAVIFGQVLQAGAGQLSRSTRCACPASRPSSMPPG